MKTNLFKKLSFSKGFTLIELLIVIAILGVLAAGVLVLIDPVQQLARARDAGRKNNIGQLSRAVQAFYTSRQAVFPVPAATWISLQLVPAGEIQAVPSDPGTSPACVTNAENDYCYTAGALGVPPAGAWVRLESQSEISKCVAGNPFFQWSSAVGRGNTCLVCTVGEPPLGAACNAVQ